MATLKRKARTGVKRTVVAGRKPNAAYRTREHLTEAEIERLMKAARRNRYGHRDATMILVTFSHGLRASEICGLEWSQFHLTRGTLRVNRAKDGAAASHPIRTRELRDLKRLQRDQQEPAGRYVFVSERGVPFTVSGFRRMVQRAGVAADMPFQIHPHMLRHSTGYKLANDGQDTRAIQDYLGHQSIESTVRYTKLAPGRFKGFWWD